VTRREYIKEKLINNNYDVNVVMGFLEEYKSLYNKRLNYKSYRNLIYKVAKEMIDSGLITREQVIYIGTTNKSETAKEQVNKADVKDRQGNVLKTSTYKMIETEEELIKHFDIDLDKWELYKFRVGKWGNPGNPSSQTRAEFRLKNKNEVDKVKELELMLAGYTPPKFTIPKYSQKNLDILLELAIPDLHLGQQSWGQEIGKGRVDNYDVHIAKKVFLDAVQYMLSKVNECGKILFPIGSDFFNVDNYLQTTARGTHQDEDVRWQKSFLIGVEACIDAIHYCRSVAPVDVVIIQGNHDYQRSFYLGVVLEHHFKDDKYVAINNNPKMRKYYSWGDCLLGLAHGHEVKMKDLPLIMAEEEPELWSKSKYREYHIGHLHHTKDVSNSFSESFRGTTVRIIPSLAQLDNWHFTKGYKSIRQAQGFEWSKSKGLVAFYPFSV